MGDNVQHSPILLMWSVIRHLILEEAGAAETRKLGNVALQLNVMAYISSMLDREPFNGKTVTQLSTVSFN